MGGGQHQSGWDYLFTALRRRRRDRAEAATDPPDNKSGNRLHLSSGAVETRRLGGESRRLTFVFYMPPPSAAPNIHHGEAPARGQRWRRAGEEAEPH